MKVAVLLVCALAAPAALALDAADVGARSVSADVVATTSAYDGVTVVSPYISASTVSGYSAQTGVTIANRGTVSTTFTFTKTTDASTVVSSVTQCASGTSVGSSCVVKFTGAAKTAGTYTFTGVANGVASSGASFDANIPGITITVKYCVLPPC